MTSNNNTQTVTVELHGDSKMDTTVPAPLQFIIPTKEWLKFCHSVDAIVEPQRNKTRFLFAAPFFGFLCGAIITMTAGVRHGNKQFDCFPNCDEIDTGSNVRPGFIIGPLCIVGSIACIICYLPTIQDKFMNQINEICQEMSKKFPSTTFHFKRNTTSYRDTSGDRRYHSNYYFEILTVNGGGIVHSPPSTAPVVEAVAFVEEENSSQQQKNTKASLQIPSGGADDDNSPAARMSKLDTMKGMISNEEYETKRREILESI